LNDLRSASNEQFVTILNVSNHFPSLPLRNMFFMAVFMQIAS